MRVEAKNLEYPSLSPEGRGLRSWVYSNTTLLNLLLPTLIM